MDFSKIQSFKNLAKKEEIYVDIEKDTIIYKIAFVSIVSAALLLIHYVHYMDIHYTNTVLVRFLQFSAIFFIIFNIALYLGYEMYNVLFLFFLVMSTPYLYHFLNKLMEFTMNFSFKTVKGRIYILTSFLFAIAVFLIIKQIAFS